MSKSLGHAPSALHCVAEAQNGRWEAFCLDFDLAVQGGSFEEVYAKLDDQIALYVESALGQPDEADRERLLRRHVPFFVIFPMMIRVVFSTLLRKGAQPRHDYVVPMRPYAPA